MCKLLGIYSTVFASCLHGTIDNNYKSVTLVNYCQIALFFSVNVVRASIKDNVSLSIGFVTYNDFKYIFISRCTFEYIVRIRISRI